MKIAQVAPLYESVPPKYYGGTERVVSHLTEELVRQGHDVTLYASGDSVTSAKLIAPCHRALRLDKQSIDQLAHHIVMLEHVARDAKDYDVIHYHVDYLHFPLSRRQVVPQVTTLHGRLNIPDLEPLYREFLDMPVVSISNDQRKPLEWLNWQGTVYHGVPADHFEFHEEPGHYLAFLGRICPEKRVDTAIEIAERLEMPLKIAAKVDKVDQEYYDDVIKPLIRHPFIDYIGEIGEAEKSDFLGNATALLFPIDWPEPFGMAMIEAMACGTPIIARNRGSVQEVIQQGVTGFICEGVDDAVAAVQQLSTFNRRRCREAFERRFTVSRMAEDYLAIYQRLIRREAFPELGHAVT